MRMTPVAVSGSDRCDRRRGECADHALALRANGTVVAWGNNTSASWARDDDDASDTGARQPA